MLYSHKCLDLMNKFVKDDTMREMLTMYIKWKDLFMHLKTGSWAPTMDLLVEKQAIAVARIVAANGKGKKMRQPRACKKKGDGAPDRGVSNK